MKLESRQVRIVLVRPRNPLNLLAAARAAANFGFDDVVVVAPYEPVWEEARETPEARQWLRHARRAPTVAEAIADRNWVLGTSCLARRKIEEPQRVIPLDRLAARAARVRHRNRIAILFGSEKRGLTNDDLSLGHAIVRIPTTSEVPSMNLGQAVAVCCYELRGWGRSGEPLGEKPAAEAASVGEINRLVNEIERLLGSAGAAAVGTESKRTTRLRQILLRWPLTSQDVTVVLGVLRDLAWRLRQSS